MILIITACGSEEPSQESNFTDLLEYNLEQVQVLADQGDLILGRPVYTEIDSDGNHMVMDLAAENYARVSGQSWYHLSPNGEPLGSLLTLKDGESLRNSVPGHVYVSGEAEVGSPVILKYRISMR